MQADIARRVEALTSERTPFVMATVVRAQRPTSVRPGDSGIVLGDGTIEGFVGGACAETSVRLQALRALETGEALLLRIVPEGDETAETEGAMVVQNPCLSGGALEIFLEPRLPAPRITVVGNTPIAQALASIGERAGYEVDLAGTVAEDSIALVVASHGKDEEDALTAALAAAVPYVGLVASRKRGAAVIDELRERDVPEEQIERVHTPAGLDIGAKTAEEIAISILAEIVATRHQHVHPPAFASAEATDPVCGMTVAIASDTPSAEHEGTTIYFCGDGCRQAFEQDPARYAAPHG
jgi:xanthine dehydrogenase accessory factor